eukprot:9110174-Lingulodinium_polyedra.AAC.1
MAAPAKCQPRCASMTGFLQAFAWQASGARALVQPVAPPEGRGARALVAALSCKAALAARE